MLLPWCNGSKQLGVKFVKLVHIFPITPFGM